MAHHGDLDLRHDLAALDAQDRGAEDLVRVGVDDRLQKTARLVHFQGAGDMRGGHFRYAYVSTLLAGLFLAKSDATELWVDEDGIRHHSANDRGVPTLNQVRAQDAVIVVRDVGKGRSTFAVAQHIDTRHTGFEAVVGLNVPALVYFDAGRWQVQRIVVGHPTGGLEEMRANNRALAVRRTDGHVDPGRDLRRLRAEQYGDAVLAQDVGHCFGDVCVFAS